MITIIGAGPAGLAIAYELAQRGLPYQILERYSVGYAWQHHYDRLRLNTLKQISGLPGQPMPPSYPDFPSRAQFLAYLHHYAQHFNLRIHAGIELRHADFDSGRWQLTTNQGVQEAAVLVMATGIWSAPVCPAFPGDAQFGGPIIHSREYRNPRLFIGQRVLVVGPGNSGTEIAVDLAEHGVTTAIAVRSGIAFVPRMKSVAVSRASAWLLRTLPRSLAERMLKRRDFGHLGLPLPLGSPLDHYPVVGYGLPEAVEAGRVTVYGAVERLGPGMAYFSGGQSAPCDAIIMATGYRPALDPVAHELEFDQQGRPVLDAYWRARKNPHLVCVGYSYPNTEGWLQAMSRVARTAVAGIVKIQRRQ